MKESEYIRVKNLTNISRALDAVRDIISDDIATESEMKLILSKLANIQEKYYNATDAA